MELWIRSQDKDYMGKVEELNLVYDCLCSDEVQLIHIDSDKARLGSYATKERALEVLDEIQKYLLKMGETEILTDKIGIMNEIKHYGIVYEMPKE